MPDAESGDVLHQAPARPEVPTGEGYDMVFGAVGRGHVLQSIYLRTYGSDALVDAEPFSAISLSELLWLLEHANVQPGQLMVDLGCGRGGVALVAARDSGARLVGIDFSRVGLRSAARRAVDFSLAYPPAFVAADLRDLPLAARSVPMFLSIDVLQLIPERDRILKGVAHALCPGGVLAFSSWERFGPDDAVPQRMLRVPRDYRSLIRSAGLRVVTLEEPAGWRDRAATYWAAVVDSAAAIEVDVGSELTRALLDEAERIAKMLANTRRVLVVARRA